MNEELKKKLLEDAKSEGLNLAEENVKKIAKFLFKIIPELAKETETSIDDHLAPFLVLAEPMVMELIDKIDGEEG